MKMGYDACVARADCAACGLYKDCRTPGMSMTLGSNGLLCIGEAPGASEDFEGEAFVGKSGKLLRRALSAQGIDPITTSYTNAVRCAPRENVIIGSAHISSCRELLSADIAQLKPRAVLLLGNTPLRSVLKKSGITKQRRKVTQVNFGYGGIPVVAAFHPAYVLRDLNLMPRFEGDIAFFAEAVAGKSRSLDDLLSRVAVSSLSPDDKIENGLRRMEQRALKNKTPIAFDVETDELLLYTRDDWRLLCVAVSDGILSIVVGVDECEEINAGIRCAYKAEARPDLDQLLALLRNPAIPKIAHNAPFDMAAIALRFGVDVAPVADDTMLQHVFLDVVRGGHDLKSAASELLGAPDWTELIKRNGRVPESGADFGRAEYASLAQYCGIDALLTARLYAKLSRSIASASARYAKEIGEAVPDMAAAYKRLSADAVAPFYRMTRAGVPVDIARLDQAEREMINEEEQLRKNLRALPAVQRRVRGAQILAAKEHGKKRARNKPSKHADVEARKQTRQISALERALLAAEFNPASDAQVGELLFGADGYGIACAERTPGGKPGTSAEVLSQIARTTPNAEAKSFCDLLLKLRGVSKLRSTSITGLRVFIGKDGRVRPSINLGGARTGRTSSSDPNMQNVPKIEKDPRVRSIFAVADPARRCLLEADYSQIELRVLAAISGCGAMLDVYRRGADLHTETAMQILGCARAQDVDETTRRIAKGVNFGIVYGESAYGLMKNLYNEQGIAIGEAEAQRYIDAVFARFPGVAEWQVRQRLFAERHGYVITPTGRVRPLRNATIQPRTTDDRRLKSDALRQAVNTPVQGGASDLKIIAVCQLDGLLQKVRGLRAQMILEVHDSILFETEIAHAQSLLRLVEQCMTVRAPLAFPYLSAVPIRVEFKSGANWAEMKPLTAK